MTAQEALKAVLRDVLVRNAREHGYKGTIPTWPRSSTAGDWAVVNVPSSSFSSAGRVRCVINLAVAPEPWLRWSRERLGAGMPKSVTESLGLFRDRLYPAGPSEGRRGWWEITDARSAVTAAAEMAGQLEAAGWPVLDRLLSPGGVLRQVRSGSLGDMKHAGLPVFFARAEAVLLMDQGPSGALDRCLRVALEGCMPAQRENAKRFDEWVRKQANAGR